jgi:hypothetical protein
MFSLLLIALVTCNPVAKVAAVSYNATSTEPMDSTTTSFDDMATGKSYTQRNEFGNKRKH